jgi:hypothetical protein
MIVGSRFVLPALRLAGSFADGRSDIPKASGVVDTATRDAADSAAVLVGQHSPPVLLYVRRPVYGTPKRRICGLCGHAFAIVLPSDEPERERDKLCYDCASQRASRTRLNSHPARASRRIFWAPRCRRPRRKT